MKRIIEKNRRRAKRKLRVRGRVTGTAQRSRLSVFRSNKNVYIQAIDDENKRTLASASSVKADMKGLKANVEDGQKIGEAIGKELVGLKITEAVFDRNGYLYHGIIKSIAEGARKAGVKF